MPKVIFTIILFFVCSGLKSQPLYSDELHQVNSFLYNFKFKSADSLLLNIEREEKNDPEVKLARANYYWWNIISGNNDNLIEEKYMKLLDQALYETKKSKQEGNKELMLFINIYSFKARINGLNKNYIKAFQNINNCISYLKSSFGRESNFEFFYLTSGLYNYYISQANKDYPILIPYLALIPGGEKEKGLKYLKISTSANDPDQRTEANYFLMKIKMEQKDFKGSIGYADKLIEQFPGNLLYRYYKFKMILKLGEKDRALEELTRIRIFGYSNPSLLPAQRDHFLSLAQKDLTKFYTEKHVN